MGRGQVLKEVTLPALHLVVAVPGVALSTRTVYGWRDEDAERAAARSGGRWRATLSARIQRAATPDDVAALVAQRPGGRRAAPPPGRGDLLVARARAGRRGRGHDGQRLGRVRPVRDEAAAVRARAALAPARAWYVTDLQPAPPPAPPSAHRRSGAR